MILEFSDSENSSESEDKNTSLLNLKFILNITEYFYNYLNNQ